jgi:hypothetical protein
MRAGGGVWWRQPGSWPSRPPPSIETPEEHQEKVNVPNLTLSTPGVTTSGVTLAVYAPFGTDAVLSNYPGNVPLKISQHPLVLNLIEVARRGVNISALVDLVGDDTWLVEIAAGKTTAPVYTARWKQDMDAHRTLSGFLKHTRKKRPGTALVLALEGHGAGYLPEIDTRQLTTANLTQGGNEWLIRGSGGTPQQAGGAPLLPMGCPLLPMGCPLLPVNHMPLSTWGLGQALKDTLADGGPKIAVLHLDNCFNMAAELLHTVAPYADFAAGYMNYNFFTAGEAYVAVFNKLATAGTASTQQLATWFAEGNRDLLATAGPLQCPTAGAAVQLSRLPGIATAVHALALALTNALRACTAAQRPAMVEKIRLALAQAQRYNTLGSMLLEPADELTDVCSLAQALRSFDGNGKPVQTAAANLAAALGAIKVYGATGQPWPEPAVTWNFSQPTLAMNILCPDPMLTGHWDWRSPYYLQTVQDPARPPLQPGVIDFLKTPGWVDFIIEYHRDVPFKTIRPAAIADYPVFTRPKTSGVTPAAKRRVRPRRPAP